MSADQLKSNTSDKARDPLIYNNQAHLSTRVPNISHHIQTTLTVGQTNKIARPISDSHILAAPFITNKPTIISGKFDAELNGGGSKNESKISDEPANRQGVERPPNGKYRGDSTSELDEFGLDRWWKTSDRINIASGNHAIDGASKVRLSFTAYLSIIIHLFVSKIYFSFPPNLFVR